MVVDVNFDYPELDLVPQVEMNDSLDERMNDQSIMLDSKDFLVGSTVFRPNGQSSKEGILGLIPFSTSPYNGNPIRIALAEGDGPNSAWGVEIHEDADGEPDDEVIAIAPTIEIAINLVRSLFPRVNIGEIRLLVDMDLT